MYQVHLVAGSGSGTASSTSVPTFANPLSVEVWVLMKRSFTNTGRMPELFVMRLGTIMVTGFILATIFWRLDDTPKGVQERLGFFAMAMSTMFYVCADALPVFVQERHIYLRETAHNAYRRLSYVFANAVVAFPPLVFLSLAFAVTTFFAVGLAGGGGSFLFFVLIILASFWAGSGFVTFLSAVVPHVMLGYTVVVAILAYFLLFSGFFINRDRIPSYWIWFHYLSLVKYPYQAVLQNEFRDATRCFSRGVEMFDGTPIGAMSRAVKLKVLDAISKTLGTNMTANTCVTTGADVLAQQAVTDIGKWKCLLVTVAWGFFFRALFYVVLLVGSKNKRR
uniref:ABC-2 type transporter transmembrane domain-containing protein n=1 Tax=Oryza barthii TaxID=65489 RepID=A0A0D3G2M5_9ORYZ